MTLWAIPANRRALVLAGVARSPVALATGPEPSPAGEPAFEEPAPGAHGAAGTDADGRCPADWRRPGEYWRCRRPWGHRGRHRMRREPGPATG